MEADGLRPETQAREGVADNAIRTYDAVLHQYRRGLILMLRRLVGDHATAEDLCQDACRIVSERLQTTGLEDSSKLVAYLHQTARNLAIAERRKRTRRRTEPDSEVIDIAPDSTFDPCDASERQQHARLVKALLGKLTRDRDRCLLVRYYLDEADKDEICRELGLTEEHFNRVLFRARQRFREILERSGITALVSFLATGFAMALA